MAQMNVTKALAAIRRMLRADAMDLIKQVGKQGGLNPAEVNEISSAFLFADEALDFAARLDEQRVAREAEVAALAAKASHLTQQLELAELERILPQRRMTVMTLDTEIIEKAAQCEQVSNDLVALRQEKEDVWIQTQKATSELDKLRAFVQSL